MKTGIRTLSLAIALLLLVSAVTALAEITSFDGSVQSSRTENVTAPIGGTAEDVSLIPGQRIGIGDKIVTLTPEGVYAAQDGTVRGIFASQGDDLDAVVSRYGAVLYLEPAVGLTVSASTDKAYDLAENKFVHAGESVYLSGVNTASHTGKGRVVSVSGTSFTVEVTDASDFAIGESVRVFRSADLSARSRIGQGTVARVDPAAVTASGSLYALKVKDGDAVKKGDLLFETLPGAFDGSWFTGNTVTSNVSGIVEEVLVTPGSSVNKGDALAAVAPTDSLYIAFSIAEADLAYAHVGDPVEIEFMWNEGEASLLRGEITFISFKSDSASGEAVYAARASFTPDDSTRIGMTAVVYTLEPEETETEESVTEE